MPKEIFIARENKLNPMNSIRQKGEGDISNILSRKEVDSVDVFSSSPKKIQTRLHNMMYSGKTESVDDNVTVNLRSLVPTQKRLDTYYLKRYMNAKQQDDNPIVARYKGNDYIIDGHHRIAAALLKGVSTMSVKRFNLKD